MKNSTKILIAIVALAVIMGLYFGSIYNKMVELDEETTVQWSKVEVQYQRRSDLIPNLVNTVKGFAAQEKDVLTSVVEARAKATSINISANDLSPENIKKFQAAQSQLSGSLSRLLVTMEKYPELKSNKNFLELQAQLEGTENRIATERGRFSESVGAFNKYIRKFPNNLISGNFGFEAKGTFESEEGTEKAPDVSF
jgi:LemA protein